MPRIVARRELPIEAESDIAVVRRAVRDIALERGFDSFATAAITTATSELARNTWLHGGGGRARIEELEESGRYGLRILFTDAGPGIGDLDRALSGGYSTRRSMGLGLSGSRRLVDEFDLDSDPERGTRVVVTKWARYAHATP